MTPNKLCVNKTKDAAFVRLWDQLGLPYGPELQLHCHKFAIPYKSLPSLILSTVRLQTDLPMTLPFLHPVCLFPCPMMQSSSPVAELPGVWLRQHPGGPPELNALLIVLLLAPPPNNDTAHPLTWRLVLFNKKGGNPKISTKTNCRNRELLRF